MIIEIFTEPSYYKTNSTNLPILLPTE